MMRLYLKPIMVYLQILTRYPFPEYHTHLDTPDLISEESLESTYNILLIQLILNMSKA